MTRQGVLPVALVSLALIADAAGVPSFAFYLLLATVPALVVSVLATLEALLEERQRLATIVLQVIALALVLLSAAIRAPLRAEGTVPRVAISAAVACVVVLALQWVIAALPGLRRTFTRAPRTATEI
jgi:hypothetical protein